MGCHFSGLCTYSKRVAWGLLWALESLGSVVVDAVSAAAAGASPAGIAAAVAVVALVHVQGWTVLAAVVTDVAAVVELTAAATVGCCPVHVVLAGQ